MPSPEQSLPEGVLPPLDEPPLLAEDGDAAGGAEDAAGVEDA